MSEFDGADNPGLFNEDVLGKVAPNRNVIVVPSGSGRPIELQTVDVVPEEYTVYEQEAARVIKGERLILRTGESLIPGVYTYDPDGELGRPFDRYAARFLGADYESVPNSLVGPVLRTRRVADEEHFRSLVGPFPQQMPTPREPRESALMYDHPAIDERIGMRSRTPRHWIRLEAGADADEHLRGKTIAARVAFFILDVEANGVIPIIYDESGHDDFHLPPRELVLPNPWLYVVMYEGDPDEL